VGGHGGRGQRQNHGQAAARRLLGLERAAHGLGEAAGERQSEPHTGGVVGVAQPLERNEHAVALWLGCLATKAALNRVLLARFAWLPRGLPANAAAMIFEMLVDLLLPLLYLSALVRPHRLSWRSRRIDLAGDSIRYE